MSENFARIQLDVPKDAAIRRQLGVEYFDQIHLTFPNFVSVSDSIRNRTFQAPIQLSAGLFAKSQEQLRALESVLTALPKSATTWTVLANELRTQNQSIRLDQPLFDLGASISDFEFQVFASRPRFFNSLTFVDSTVEKSTAWKEKGKAEARFYRSIPNELRLFFPKFLAERESDDRHYYKIEQKRCFDLGRHALQDSLTASEWALLAEKFKLYFSRTPKQTVTIEELLKSERDLFVEKLSARFIEFKKMPLAYSLFEKFATATGVDFSDTVAELQDNIEKKLRLRAHSMTDARLAFIHGDLCFSNILFDREASEVSFVDPRGLSTENAQNQPPVYDLAKLGLSLYGNYEFLVFNKEPSRHWRRNARHLFESLVVGQAEKVGSIIPLIASLFWSSLPLHADSPDRIYRFMIAGHELFQDSK